MTAHPSMRRRWKSTSRPGVGAKAVGKSPFPFGAAYVLSNQNGTAIDAAVVINQNRRKAVVSSFDTFNIQPRTKGMRMKVEFFECENKTTPSASPAAKMKKLTIWNLAAYQ